MKKRKFHLGENNFELYNLTCSDGVEPSKSTPSTTKISSFIGQQLLQYESLLNDPETSTYPDVWISSGSRMGIRTSRARS